MKIEDVTVDSLGGFTLLLYGDIGTGKTALAASAGENPLMSKILIIDIDGGLKTIAGKKDAAGNFYKRVVLDSYTELAEVFKLIAAGKDEYEGINTIIVDNLSALAGSVLAEINEDKQANPQSQGDRKRQTGKNFLEDYGIMTAFISRSIDMFKSLGKTLILVAQKTVDTAEGTAILRPDLSPKLGKRVGEKVDFMWMTRKANAEFGLLTEGTLLGNGTQISAKTRNEPFRQRILRESYQVDGQPTGLLKVTMQSNGILTPSIADLYNWYREENS